MKNKHPVLDVLIAGETKYFVQSIQSLVFEWFRGNVSTVDSNDDLASSESSGTVELIVFVTSETPFEEPSRDRDLTHLSALQRLHPQAACIVLTDEQDQEALTRILDLGRISIVSKRDCLEELIDIFSRTCTGEFGLLSSGIADKLPPRDLVCIPNP